MPINRGSRPQPTPWRDRDAWKAHALAADDLGQPRRVSPRTVRDVIDELHRHMGADGYARPGSAVIADHLELSRPTVELALSRLVALGWLIRTVAAGGRGRRAVYLAATPLAPCEPDDDATCPQCVAMRNTNSPEVLRRATQPGDERCDAQHKPARTPGVKTLTPPPPQSPPPAGDQLTLPTQLTAVNGGGGGTPAGETATPTISAATQAVVDALPPHLGQQLLDDPRLHHATNGNPGIDARITNAARFVSRRVVVEVLAARLPNDGDVADIAALLLSHARLGRLENRVKAEANAHTAQARQRRDDAARLGDTNALNDVGRNEFITSVLDHYFADDPGAYNAGLAAYDDAIAAIRRQEGTSA